MGQELLDYLFPIIYIVVVVIISFVLDQKSNSLDQPNRTPVEQMNQAERALYDINQKMAHLRKEATRLNSPDTFVEHSKVNRQIMKLEKDQERAKLALQEHVQEMGGQDNARQQVMKFKMSEIRKNATRNKLIIAFVLSFVFDRTAHFAFDADQLFPLEYFIGKKEEDGTFSFRLTWLFTFFLIRFSNRLITTVEWTGKKLFKVKDTATESK